MQVLVLNAQGTAHRIITWEEAMEALHNQGDPVKYHKRSKKLKKKPIVIEYYDDHLVHSAHSEWRVPSIIQFLDVKMRPSKGGVRYSRNNIYIRDKGRCQYCGILTTRAEFTLDHVIPKAQNGKTTWENTVVSCVECNTRKGGKTPVEAGMHILRVPTKPTDLPPDSFFKLRWHPSMPASWKAYMRDTLYWEGELDNDN